MTKIILTRHGHVEGIEPERFRGRENLPLTGRGRAEAQAVAERIASAWQPVAIYTSPLERCIVTGAAIAKACHLAAAVLADLNDIDYGAWQFKPIRRYNGRIRSGSRHGLPHRILSAFRMASHCRICSHERRTPCGSSSRATPTTPWSSSAMIA
jgi:hypothetical protein